MRKILTIFIILISITAFGAGEFNRLLITESATIPIINGDVSFTGSATIDGVVTMKGINTASSDASSYMTLVDDVLTLAPVKILKDGDGDTSIDVEQTSDNDEIILTTNNLEIAKFHDNGMDFIGTTKLLEIQFSANDVKLMSGPFDPRLTPVDAPSGSAYHSETGNLFIKKDDGHTTNWDRMLDESIILDDIEDVNISSTATDEILRFNGAEWVNSDIGLSDIITLPASVQENTNNIATNTASIAENSEASSSITIKVNQVGHGRAIGPAFIPVYFDGTIWNDASANQASTLATHLIVEVTDVDNFKVAAIGRYEYPLGHGLTPETYYYTANATGSLTNLEPSLSNPIVFAEDANFLQVLNWRAYRSSSQTKDHPVYTPTGTTQTIDWNLGKSSTIDLDDATGDVILTLNNPDINENYWIKFIQGSTPRNVYYPSNVSFPGGVTPVLTLANDAVDILDLKYNGSDYYGTLRRNFINAYGNIYSVLFDGIDEYAISSFVPGFERTNAFSASAWIKTSSAATQVLLSNRQSSGDNRGMYLGVQSGTLFFVMQSTSTNRIIRNSVGTVNDGAWHFVTITYDGSSTAGGVKFYIDNVLQSTTTTSDTLTTTIVTTEQLRIGGWANMTTFFVGNIDEVGIWNKELSVGDIDSAWNNGKPTNLSLHASVANLAGWWRMGDSDTYPTLEDQIGSNDATMTNMEEGDIETDVP